jgi:hypothetical protein
MLVSIEFPHRILALDEESCLLGYSLQSLVGQSIQLLEGHHTDSHMLHDAIATAGVHGSREFQVALYDIGGRCKNMHASCIPQYGEFGTCSCCRLVLGLSPAILLSSVFEERSCAFALVSAEWPHFVETINDLFIAQFGLSAQEIVGQNLHRIKPIHTESTPWRALLTAASQGHRSHHQVAACLASGDEAQIELMGIPVVREPNASVDHILVLLSEPLNPPRTSSHPSPVVPSPPPQPTFSASSSPPAAFEPSRRAAEFASAGAAPHPPPHHSAQSPMARNPVPPPSRAASAAAPAAVVLDDAYVRRVRRRHLTAERRAAAAAAKKEPRRPADAQPAPASPCSESPPPPSAAAHSAGGGSGCCAEPGPGEPAAGWWDAGSFLRQDSERGLLRADAGGLEWPEFPEWRNSAGCSAGGL